MAALAVVIAAVLCTAVTLGSSEIKQNVNTEPLDGGEMTERRLRIIGGEPACRDQFRHHALVVGDDKFNCGGALIKPTAILTIGWCVAEYKKFDIRLGTLMRQGPDDSAFIVQSIWGLVHPEYNKGGYFNNDIAVILLNVEVPLGRSIWPVMLPSIHEVNTTFTGRRALISGWGRLNNTSPLQDRLRFAELTVISNDLCKKFYERGYILDSTMCAGNENTGFCDGDYGGPLVIKTGGQYKLIGMASFLLSYCDKPEPGAYTRVTSFLEWIKKAAGNLDDWRRAKDSHRN